MKEFIANTSFFRRLKDRSKAKSDDRPKTYWGRLGERLVESDKQVIVYDIRGVLHSSDSVEDATDFYIKKKTDFRIASGAIYRFCEKGWRRVVTDEIQVTA